MALRRAACSEPRPGDVDGTTRRDSAPVGREEVERRRGLERVTPLELNPDGADSHLFYAHLLSNTGRHPQALAEAKRARELDPLNLRINALKGQFLIHARRTD